MGGGLLQLISYGLQDAQLTQDPDITFWRLHYRRHTNFAIESIQNVFQGAADFGKKSSVVIARNGDLVSRIWLEITLPALSNYAVSPYQAPQGTQTYLKWANNIAHLIVKSIEMSIGGHLIDRHYSEYWDIWSELSEKEEKREGYNSMVGKFDDWDITSDTKSAGSTPQTFYLPLTFFNCQHNGLVIPLVCLSHQDIQLNFEFRSYLDCIRFKTLEEDPIAVPITAVLNNAQELSVSGLNVYVDYVYLDADERQRFVEMEHEMLITQLQWLGDTAIANNDSSCKIPLDFSHPVKELIWTFNASTKYSTSDPVDGNSIFDYDAVVTSGNDSYADDPFMYARLLLNGSDRFSERPSHYFKLVQPYQFHTRVPKKRIFVYSFALNPEDPAQPTGACNFSRLDTSYLNLRLPSGMGSGKFKVFALSWNVLKIGQGMAGIAFT